MRTIIDHFDSPMAGAPAIRASGTAAGDVRPQPTYRPSDLAQYAGELRRFARRRVRDDALAEDAVQDALLAALVSLPGFRGTSSLKTWLLGILAHKIHDGFRRENRYVRLPESDADECAGAGDDPCGALAGAPVSERDPLREVARRRFGASVTQALESLPASLREVFQMQAIDGLSTEDVCLRLGISESNCWVRLHRARKRLSAMLAGHY